MSDSIDKREWSSSDELSQLKRDMAEKIIEEYNKKQWGLLSDIFKDNIVDYVVDEWDIWFTVALKMWLLKDSAKDLETLQKKIKETNEKEELSSLENEIINNLKNKWVFFEKSSETTSNNPENSGNESGSTQQTDYDAVQEIDYNTPHLESAALWQAKEIPLSRRMNWLFPVWVPATEKEMLKYITKIKVPIHTPEGKKKELTLNIHKKLANEYQSIFQEMYNKKIPVNPASTWGYNWRKMRRWTKLSHHSYWSAVDVNRDVNGWVYGKTDRNSPYFNNQTMVNIRKKHGFYRWWDRSKRSNDPMHFTYMNG